MKNLFYILAIIFFFSGCSTKQPVNKWQYDSSNAFSSYKENFLQGNNLLAEQDFKRAVKNAKRSADFTQLASLYLGKCALNKSVGIADNCNDYISIAPFIKNPSLEAYYHFISLNFDSKEIELLPYEYQDVAQYYLQKDFISLEKSIKKIDKITSKLLITSLSISLISDTLKKDVLKDVSNYGYKQAVLFLLNKLINTTNDINEKELIAKKIKILKE